MRNQIAVSLLTLVAAAAFAQQPSAKDILTWVSSHFEMVHEPDRAVGTSTLHQSVDTRLEFKDCQVTLMESIVTTSTPPEPYYDRNGNVLRTYGPFNLSDLMPNSATAVQNANHTYSVKVEAVHAVPLTVQNLSNNTTVAAVTESTLEIPFATEELAKRQAKAWRDAIIGCGGKAVPDNLY